MWHWIKWVNHASFSFEYLNKDTATSVRRNIKRLTALAKKHHRPVFNESDLCDFLGISPEAANKVNKNNSQDFVSSLYQYFTRKITTNGLIVWRVRSTSVQVTLFNNYDLETGDFKVDLPSTNDWEKSKVLCPTKKLNVIQSNRCQCCINIYWFSSNNHGIQNY